MRTRSRSRSSPLQAADKALPEIQKENASTGIQNERPHQCSVCGSCFKTKNGLEWHEIIHNKGFKDEPAATSMAIVPTQAVVPNQIVALPGFTTCSLCDKKFRFPSDLSRHLLTHSGYKPFVCSVCSRPFNTKSNRDRHEKTHTGYTLHVCSLCSRKYASRQKLDEHFSKHHDDSNRVFCDECSKNFPTSSSLELHKRRMHLNDRPYTCFDCSRTYVTEADLRKHLNTKGIHLAYSCSKCNQQFPARTDMLQHEAIHAHDEDEEQDEGMTELLLQDDIQQIEDKEQEEEVEELPSRKKKKMSCDIDSQNENNSMENYRDEDERPWIEKVNPFLVQLWNCILLIGRTLQGSPKDEWTPKSRNPRVSLCRQEF